MTIDPDVVDMIGKIAAVNAVATLLLALLSYAWSVFALNALASLDRWLDPSREAGDQTEDGGF